MGRERLIGTFGRMDRVLEEPWTHSQSAKTSIQYIAILRPRGLGGRETKTLDSQDVDDDERCA